MKTVFEFNQNKIKRLVKKGVLTTSITGGPYFTNNEQKSVPRFPHLFTAIGENFSIYRSMGFTPETIGLSFLVENLQNEEPIKQIEQMAKCDAFPTIPENLYEKISNYAKEKSYPEDGKYWFLDEKLNLYVFFPKKFNGTNSLQGMLVDSNSLQYKFLVQLIIKSYPDHKEPIYLGSRSDDINTLTNISGVVRGENIEPTNAEVIIARLFNPEIIREIFDETTISATYYQSFNSLIEKMKDNLYQFFVINPYEMGRAILNAKVGLFLYHFFGMIHALLSIPVDLAVEATALVTRSVKQACVSGYGCLFSSTERASTSGNPESNINLDM